MGQPRQRHLRRRAARARRHLVDGLEHGEPALGHVALLHAGRARGRRQRRAAAVLAGEEPAAERGVRDHGHALLEAERLQLALVLVAEDEVVLRLNRLVTRVVV